MLLKLEFKQDSDCNFKTVSKRAILSLLAPYIKFFSFYIYVFAYLLYGDEDVANIFSLTYSISSQSAFTLKIHLFKFFSVIIKGHMTV